MEVRWFFPGKLPENVWHWYSRDGTPHQEPARNDKYLLGTGKELGIKLREGSLEIKQQKQSFGENQFSQNIVGRVDSWVKWSFPLKNQREITQKSNTGSHWVDVEKKRWLKVFLLDEAFSQVPPMDFPAKGCSWEVSQINSSISPQTWWSMCFELFSADGGKLEELKAILANALPPNLDVSLQAMESFGYPAWLYKISG